jgi:hypothetical protein
MARNHQRLFSFVNVLEVGNLVAVRVQRLVQTSGQQ